MLENENKNKNKQTTTTAHKKKTIFFYKDKTQNANFRDDHFIKLQNDT